MIKRRGNINHVFDLEKRTFEFAKVCRDFVKTLPTCTANQEYTKQLIRSSGSQAANYIEANESLSKKDFVYRIKIARKEAKESRLWLNLITTKQDNQSKNLIIEATELIKIFSAIIKRST